MEKTYQQISNLGGALVCGADSFGDRFLRDIDDADERRRETEFHIQRGDYFAVLATFCHIAANEKDVDMRKIFSKLAEDLQYLQNNYEITKKPTRPEKSETFSWPR